MSVGHAFLVPKGHKGQQAYIPRLLIYCWLPAMDSSEGARKKVLNQRKQEVEKLWLGLCDALGEKAAIFTVDEKGSVQCKSSLEGPGFHVVAESENFKNLVSAHVIGDVSSDLFTTLENSMMRTENSKKHILRKVVIDLQLRRDPKKGERPIIQRARNQPTRAMEVSRMDKDQIITLLLAYAKEGMKLHRGARKWLEARYNLPPCHDNMPQESFCTLDVSKKLASFTKARRTDDKRTRGNADELRKASWKNSGESNLNRPRNNANDSSQQEEDQNNNDDNTNEVELGEGELRVGGDDEEEEEEKEEEVAQKEEDDDEQKNEEDEDSIPFPMSASQKKKQQQKQSQPRIKPVRDEAAINASTKATTGKKRRGVVEDSSSSVQSKKIAVVVARPPGGVSTSSVVTRGRSSR